VAGTCPQCRYTLTLDGEAEPLEGRSPEEVASGSQQKTYPGDRILVGKFIFDFAEPQRWDVVVFKFPGDTKMNYIKRLVGLPGEDIHIRHGDIYVRPTGTQEKLRIARKPPNKQLAMMQVVFDTKYTSSDLVKKKWPLRWQTSPQEDGKQAGGWQLVPITAEELTEINVHPVYTIAAGSEAPRWLRYRHIVPGWKDWVAMAAGPLGENYPARPELITDYYAYNTSLSRLERNEEGSLAPDTRRLGLHWVGDLMVEAAVEVENDRGELLLDLVEGGLHFTCRIDVATGLAQLESSAAELKDFHPQSQTSLRGPGSYHLRFANVDNQLRLWIDDELIAFEADTTFELNVMRPESTPTEPGDLAPAGIGSKGAALRVTSLQLSRDIYYIADSYEHNGPGGLSDYPFDAMPFLEGLDPEQYAEFLSNPSRWEVYTKRRAVSFALEKNPHDSARDQFFMLGDNSPFSKDSRLWPDRSINLKFFVERQLLIGKALCIYWPHSWHRVPGTSIPFPYFPNFADMSLVR
jgi:signal peptidase I